MPNFLMFVLAEMFAKRRGESSGEAVRVALPAMLLSSPLGLVLAIALANRDAPAADAKPTTSSSALKPSPNLVVGRRLFEGVGIGQAAPASPQPLPPPGS